MPAISRKYEREVHKTSPDQCLAHHVQAEEPMGAIHIHGGQKEYANGSRLHEEGDTRGSWFGDPHPKADGNTDEASQQVCTKDQDIIGKGKTLRGKYCLRGLAILFQSVRYCRGNRQTTNNRVHVTRD